MGIGEKGDQAVDVRMYNQQDIVDVCLRQDIFFTLSGKMAAISAGREASVLGWRMACRQFLPDLFMDLPV